MRYKTSSERQTVTHVNRVRDAIQCPFIPHMSNKLSGLPATSLDSVDQQESQFITYKFGGS